MRIAFALLALAASTAHAQIKAPGAPPSALPKPVPCKDAAAVIFEKFELKDTDLLSVLRVIRAKAYNQGELIDMVFVDPKGELAGRVVSISLSNVSAEQIMKHLSVLAAFKYTIKGASITVEPK